MYFQKLDNGDLLIKAVTWEDNMGLYKCVVENTKGRDEVKTFLYPVSEGQGFWGPLRGKHWAARNELLMR